MRYSNLYLNLIHQRFPCGPYEPTPHRNPVVIFDTGHHLTTHPTDIMFSKGFYYIIQSCVLIACIENALSKMIKIVSSCKLTTRKTSPRYLFNNDKTNTCLKFKH